MLRSPAEAAFYCAWTTAFPSLPLGFQVRILGTRRRTVVDFATLAPVKVAVEVDSMAWHRNPIDKARDAERDRELEALGWTVVRVQARDVFREPGATVERVHQAILRERDGALVRSG